MTFQSLRRAVYALGTVTIVAVVVNRIIQYGFGPSAFGAWTGPLASITIVTPMVVYLAFFLLSGMPGGRLIVPIPATKAQDSMLFVLVLTQFIPDVETHALVPPGWPGGSREQTFVTLFTALLCMASRVYQLNRGRKSATTLEDGTVPTA